MVNSVEVIDNPRAISLRVGALLLSKGFVLTSYEGMGSSSVPFETDALGIFIPEKERSYLFGLIKETPRRDFVGMIEPLSKPDWVFHVFGKQHLERIRLVSEEMAKTFDVKITVCLEQETPRLEFYSSDTDV